MVKGENSTNVKGCTACHRVYITEKDKHYMIDAYQGKYFCSIGSVDDYFSLQNRGGRCLCGESNSIKILNKFCYKCGCEINVSGYSTLGKTHVDNAICDDCYGELSLDKRAMNKGEYVMYEDGYIEYAILPKKNDVRHIKYIPDPIFKTKIVEHLLYNKYDNAERYFAKCRKAFGLDNDERDDIKWMKKIKPIAESVRKVLSRSGLGIPATNSFDEFIDVYMSFKSYYYKIDFDITIDRYTYKVTNKDNKLHAEWKSMGW